MDHSRMLSLSLSPNLFSIINTTNRCPSSKRSRKPSRFLTGETSMLMNTTSYSMRQLVLRENLAELITKAGTQAEPNTPLRVYKLIFLATLEVSTIGTTLAIYHRQMLSVKKTKSPSKLSQDSQLWVSGRLIGARDTTFPLDIISSKMLQRTDIS